MSVHEDLLHGPNSLRRCDLDVCRRYGQPAIRIGDVRKKAKNLKILYPSSRYIKGGHAVWRVISGQLSVESKKDCVRRKQLVASLGGGAHVALALVLTGRHVL